MRPIAHALLVISLLVSAASAASLHVPGSYPTIQAAIDASVAGDKVVVAPGVYYGAVKLKPGVTLKGSGWKTCVIDGEGKASVVTLSSASTAKTVVWGFTIRNPHPGVNLFSASGVLVKVGINDAVNLKIRNNRFENCRVGFLGSGGKTGLIEFWRNQFVGMTYYAISIHDWVPMEIRNNSMVHCGLNGISGGVNATAPLVVENNILAFNTGYGIQAGPATSKVVRYNVLHQNSKGPFTEIGTGGAGTSWNPSKNLLVNPKLIDHAAHDVHLKSTSPCIDAGVPGETDSDNSPIDIGARPFQANYVAPTAETYGVACGGLTMTHDGQPWLGSVGLFSIGVTGAPPNAPLFLLTGLSNSSWNGLSLPADYPGAPGCKLLVAPLFIVAGTVADSNGTLTIPTALSDNPLLVGLPIYLQWAASAPGANGAGVIFSDGLGFSQGN